MASVASIQQQITELATNNAEQAAEVARIRIVLEDIRQQLSAGATPEQLAEIEQQLTTVIGEQQAVEDNLRGTT